MRLESALDLSLTKRADYVMRAAISLARHSQDGGYRKIREVSQLVQKTAGYKLEAWKPAVGENLFLRESGAVASQFHIPEAIEPFAAELVGARRQIVLGKKSGLDSIALKLKELGLQVPEAQRQALLEAVKRKGIEKRGLVTDAEFSELVQGLRDQSPH